MVSHVCVSRRPVKRFPALRPTASRPYRQQLPDRQNVRDAGHRPDGSVAAAVAQADLSDPPPGAMPALDTEPATMASSSPTVVGDSLGVRRRSPWRLLGALVA